MNRRETRCFVSSGCMRIGRQNSSFVESSRNTRVRVAKRGLRTFLQPKVKLSSAATVSENVEPPKILVAKSEASGSALRDIMSGIGELAQPLWRGNRGGVAWAWTIGALVFAFGTTLLAAAQSQLLRTFWNSLSSRDYPQFKRLMVMYVGAVVLGPIVISLFEWIKRRLALMWRAALTKYFVHGYLHKSTHYRLLTRGEPVDNPDQRIADDISAFTTKAVRFFCVGIVAICDLAVFSVLLYRVYPPLLLTLVVYTAVGTTAVTLVGRRLVPLNRQQLSREADFRYALIRVRESSESIAFYGGESAEKGQLGRRFEQVFGNALRLFGRSRDVEYLSATHRYWAQIIPISVIAPAYFGGTMPLGNVSLMFFSFNHVLAGFGLAIAEFAALAEFSAGVRRLRQLSRRMRQEADDAYEGGRITREYGAVEGAGELRVVDVSLETPSVPPRTLVQEVSLHVKHGQRLLIVGTSGIGKSSLLRALAGLWDAGTGHVEMPAREHTLFLPQRPFISIGSLRENVTYPGNGESIGDEEIETILATVNLKHVSERMGGLDASGEQLAKQLSLGEQQRLAFARVLVAKPRFLVGDEFTSALDLENERLLYQLLQESGITCISVGNRPSLLEFHDVVLHLQENGKWNIESPAAAALRLNVQLNSATSQL